MNVLRLYCPIAGLPSRCDWVLLRDKDGPLTGRGALRELPRRADRVQVVLPAADVLITQTKLPPAARRRADATLNFAVEDRTVSDPEANHVRWLGQSGDHDVVTVVDKAGLERWRKALGEAGIRRFELHAETLMLPRRPEEWSFAWNGNEGFVRHGDVEAMATDAGDAKNPPLALGMLVGRARSNGDAPAAIALYLAEGIPAPDLQAWESELRIPVRPAGAWDWKSAGIDASRAIAHEVPGMLGLASVLPRLRFAAWVTGIALALHGVAIAVDWGVLASEQRSLRQQMDQRFRSVYPDAVAVVDPILQMRRKVAEARHLAGKPDAGDFLPMVGKVGATLKDLPAGTLRMLSYDSGRMTLDASPLDEARLRQLLERLRQTGFAAEGTSASGRATITVRTP